MLARGLLRVGSFVTYFRGIVDVFGPHVGRHFYSKRLAQLVICTLFTVRSNTPKGMGYLYINTYDMHSQRSLTVLKFNLFTHSRYSLSGGTDYNPYAPLMLVP